MEDPEDEKQDTGYKIPDYTPRQIRTSAAIVIGGTLTAFFSLQAMALYISEDYRDAVLDGITPDIIFGEWDTERELKERALKARFDPKP